MNKNVGVIKNKKAKATAESGSREARAGLRLTDASVFLAFPPQSLTRREGEGGISASSPDQSGLLKGKAQVCRGFHGGVDQPTTVWQFLSGSLVTLQGKG